MRLTELIEGSLPSNSHCKSPLLPIPPLDNRHLPPKKAPRAIEDLVRVPVVAATMRVRRAVM